MRQTRLASDVGKGAVAIVAEEIAGGLGACGGRGGTGAIHQEDIRPAVVIVVDDRYATTHLFEQKLLVEGRSRGISRVAEPSRNRRIREARCEWLCGGQGPNQRSRTRPL